MAEIDERGILVCHRMADCDPHVKSTADECDRCRSNVWRAVSSPQTHLIFCSQCAYEIFGPIKPPERQDLTLEQIKDITRYYEAKKKRMH